MAELGALFVRPDGKDEPECYGGVVLFCAQASSTTKVVGQPFAAYGD